MDRVRALENQLTNPPEEYCKDWNRANAVEFGLDQLFKALGKTGRYCLNDFTVAAAVYMETIEYAVGKVNEQLDKLHVHYLKRLDVEYTRQPENPSITTGASVVIYVLDMEYREILKLWDSMSEVFAYNLHPYLRDYVHLVLRRSVGDKNQG